MAKPKKLSFSISCALLLFALIPVLSPFVANVQACPRAVHTLTSAPVSRRLARSHRRRPHNLLHCPRRQAQAEGVKRRTKILKGGLLCPD